MELGHHKRGRSLYFLGSASFFLVIQDEVQLSDDQNTNDQDHGIGAFYRVPFSVLVRLVIYRGIASNDSIQIYLFLPFAHLIFASLVSKSTHTDACSNSRVNCQPLRVVRL